MTKVGIYTRYARKREKNKVQTMFVNKAKYLDHTKLDLWLTRHAEESEEKEIRSPHRAKLIPVCIKQFNKSADSIRNLTAYTEKLFKIPCVLSSK